MSNEVDDIYEMKLHDYTTLVVGGGWDQTTIRITRVPGGWLYKFANDVKFVPFDNEFLLDK